MDQPPPTDAGGADLPAAPAEPGSPDAPAAPPAGPDTPIDAPPATPPKPGPKRGLIIGGVIALVLVLAGVAAAFVMLKGSGEQLMDKVPASADVVISAYLNPSAGQKANLFRLTGNFPALGSEDDIKQKIGEFVDQALGEQGLSHEDFDWIGDQVVVVLDLPDGVIGMEGGSPDVAVIIDVDDEDQANATIDKLRSLDDEESDDVFTKVGDGVAILTSTQSMLDQVEGTMAGNQQSLADDANYQATVEGLPEGRLGLLYVGGSVIGDAAKNALLQEGVAAAASGVDISSLDALRGVGLTLSAESNGLAIDTQVGLDPSKLPEGYQQLLDGQTGENPLVGDVPSDAFGFVAVRGLNDSLRPILGLSGDGGVVDGLDVSGVLDSLTGDAVLEVTPGATPDSMPEGALLIGTSDEERMRKFLGLLPSLIPQPTDLPGVVPGEDDGTSFPDAPLSVGAGGASEQEPGLARQVELTPPPKPEITESEYQGVRITTITVPDEPDLSPSWAVNDGAAIIGSTVDAVKAVIDAQKGGDTIGSSPTYQTALGQLGDAQPGFYLDVQAVVAAVKAVAGLDEIPPEAAVNLEPLKSVIVGTEASSDHQRVRFFVQIGDP